MTYKKLQQGLIHDVRKMFIMALVGGVLGVCVPQYLNIPLLAVVLPFLCMILYTWIGYLHSEDSSFIEQFADSVYYLGFLLTLVALVVSLYFYQSDSLEAGLLTANFSLALITTIFGLAVRIFINNFQIDLGSVERQMMTEVEHAANDMIRKAKLISMQLDVSHQETQIAIRKSIDDAAEGMQKTRLIADNHAKISSEALLKNTQLTQKAIRATASAFEENILNIKLPEEIFAERMNDPLNQLISRMDETHTLLKQLNVGQSDISENTRKIIASMGKTVAEVDILAQSISVFNDKLYANTKVNDDFVRVVKDISLLAERTVTISENLEKQTQQSSLAMQNYSKMVEAVHDLPQNIDALSQSLKLSAGQVAQAFQFLGEGTESGARIGSDLQEISSALMNTRETVKQISDFGMHVTSTFKRLETFNQLMEQHTQLMADMGGVAKLDIDLAKQHQLEMAGILQKSRQALEYMQQDVVGRKNNTNNRLQG